MLLWLKPIHHSLLLSVYKRGVCVVHIHFCIFTCYVSPDSIKAQSEEKLMCSWFIRESMPSWEARGTEEGNETGKEKKQKWSTFLRWPPLFSSTTDCRMSLAHLLGGAMWMTASQDSQSGKKRETIVIHPMAMGGAWAQLQHLRSQLQGCSKGRWGLTEGTGSSHCHSLWPLKAAVVTWLDNHDSIKYQQLYRSGVGPNLSLVQMHKMVITIQTYCLKMGSIWHISLLLPKLILMANLSKFLTACFPAEPRFSLWNLNVQLWTATISNKTWYISRRYHCNKKKRFAHTLTILISANL